MTDLSLIEWLLLTLVLYAGTITGLLFGAWLKWWPDIKAMAEMRKRTAADELMAARIRRVVREDYLRAKFDEESA